MRRASAGWGGGSPSRWGPPGVPLRFRPGATGFSDGGRNLRTPALGASRMALFTASSVCAFNHRMAAGGTPRAKAPVCLATCFRDTRKARPPHPWPPGPQARTCPAHLARGKGRARRGGRGGGSLTSSSPAGAGGARGCRCVASTWGTAAPPPRARRPSAETGKRTR